MSPEKGPFQKETNYYIYIYMIIVFKESFFLGAMFVFRGSNSHVTSVSGAPKVDSARQKIFSRHSCLVFSMMSQIHQNPKSTVGIVRISGTLW